MKYCENIKSGIKEESCREVKLICLWQLSACQSLVTTAVSLTVSVLRGDGEGGRDGESRRERESMIES